MKIVSSLPGVDSIAMDMKDRKLTVTGDIYPMTVVAILRKLCHTELDTVGPAKELEKKKEEPKKEEAKKGDDKKKDSKDNVAQFWKAYYNQPPPMPPYYHYGNAKEHGANDCVIC